MDRLYFNPGCSKCRTAQGILAEAGVKVELLHYLDRPPTADELHELMGLLGIDDPRSMMRTGEPIYADLGLSEVSGEDLLTAIVSHPILLERPIYVHGGRAVIARPPERVLDLLSPGA
jgi:arsenate reductase